MHVGKATSCYIHWQNCCTRDESQGNIYHVCLCQVQIRLPTLALKPRWKVTRSLKNGYQWPQKWTRVQQNLKRKGLIIHKQFPDTCRKLHLRNLREVLGGHRAHIPYTPPWSLFHDLWSYWENEATMSLVWEILLMTTKIKWKGSSHVFKDIA